MAKSPGQEKYPGIRQLRKLLEYTRIPCACGKVASRVRYFRPLCISCCELLALTPHERRLAHAERTERRRAKLEMLKLCINCGQDAEPQRKHCSRCLVLARQRTLRASLLGGEQADRRKKRMRDYAKQRREQHRLACKCQRCGKRNDRLPLKTCRSCASSAQARHAFNRRQQRLELVRAGLDYESHAQMFGALKEPN